MVSQNCEREKRLIYGQSVSMALPYDSIAPPPHAVALAKQPHFSLLLRKGSPPLSAGLTKDCDCSNNSDCESDTRAPSGWLLYLLATVCAQSKSANGLLSTSRSPASPKPPNCSEPMVLSSTSGSISSLLLRLPAACGMTGAFNF